MDILNDAIEYFSVPHPERVKFAHQRLYVMGNRDEGLYMFRINSQS